MAIHVKGMVEECYAQREVQGARARFRILLPR